MCVHNKGLLVFFLAFLYLCYLKVKFLPDLLLLTFRRKDADFGIADVDGDTPLHLAAAGGFSELVKLLVRNGAKLHVRNLVSFDFRIFCFVLYFVFFFHFWNVKKTGWKNALRTRHEP